MHFENKICPYGSHDIEFSTFTWFPLRQGWFWPKEKLATKRSEHEHGGRRGNLGPVTDPLKGLWGKC